MYAYCLCCIFIKRIRLKIIKYLLIKTSTKLKRMCNGHGWKNLQDNDGLVALKLPWDIRNSSIVLICIWKNYEMLSWVSSKIVVTYLLTNLSSNKKIFWYNRFNTKLFFIERNSVSLKNNSPDVLINI